MRAARLIAVAAAIATMALAATSAQAAFSPSNQSITITGTVTWEKPGSAPVNCALTWVRQANGVTNNQSPPCNGRTMTTPNYLTGGWLTPQGNGVFSAVPLFAYVYPTPFGSTWMVASQFQAPFVNGNASTPSTIVLNDTVAGRADHASGDFVTWSGTLTVTQTATGGLVTVVP